MAHREGEADKTYFRTSRVFNANGAWYFATREGEDHGPFVDRETAEHELRKFLAKFQPPEDKTAEERKKKAQPPHFPA